jgi:AcrR family transcriptional regulator
VSEAKVGYHHGDLRQALVRAALEMARERGAQGAQAVVLREATRRAGVTPRAAYRHFADREALLRAAAQVALGEMARAIENRQSQHPAAAAGDPAALLTGVGLGYIHFALDEPGWFDVAFFAMADMLNTASPPARGPAGRSPYEQLQDVLQALVATGLLAPERFADAAVTCWSGVHGFAALTALGPLRELPRELVNAQAERLVADLVDAVTRRSTNYRSAK